ncbi:hypothetical protein ACWFNE_04660 [Cellulomonas sp. NPDC055163]
MSTSLRTAGRRAAVLAAAVLLGAAATAGPATARPDQSAQGTGAEGTRCSDHAGTISRQVVEGDLVVDGRCTLTSVLVRGDVELVPGGRLVLFGSTVDGSVTGPASVDLLDSLVRGGVTLTSRARLYAEESSVRRSVRTEAGGVRIVRTSVGGALNVAAKEQPEDWVVIHLSTVAGWVSAYGGHQQVVDSTLGRGLTATGWTRALELCGTTVAVDVTLRGGHGPASACSTGSPVTVGGSLVVQGSAHPVDLRALSVAGDLRCEGGTGRITTASDVSVSGSRTGRCAP